MATTVLEPSLDHVITGSSSAQMGFFWTSWEKNVLKIPNWWGLRRLVATWKKWVNYAYPWFQKGPSQPLHSLHQSERFNHPPTTWAQLFCRGSSGICKSLQAEGPKNSEVPRKKNIEVEVFCDEFGKAEETKNSPYKTIICNFCCDVVNLVPLCHLLPTYLHTKQGIPSGTSSTLLHIAESNIQHVPIRCVLLDANLNHETYNHKVGDFLDVLKIGDFLPPSWQSSELRCTNPPSPPGKKPCLDLGLFWKLQNVWSKSMPRVQLCQEHFVGFSLVVMVPPSNQLA